MVTARLLSLAGLVSLAQAFAFPEGCEPRQVHIAGGADASKSLSVSWVTDGSECGDFSSVSYSSDGWTKSVGNAAPSSPTRYNQTTTKYGTYVSPYLWNCELPDLAADTEYSFAFGATQPSPPSPPSPSYSFKTAPSATSSPSSSLYPTKIAMVGDLGQTSDSASTVANIAKEEVDFIAHAGDMSYADCDHDRWDSWFDMVEDVSSNTPWYVVGGNHEIEHSDVDGEIFVAYENRFNMPKIKPAEMEPFTGETSCTPSAFLGKYDWGNSFYKFAHGPSTFLMLNSYTDSAPGSPQYAWVESTLAGIDREATPWVFALFHSPFYNSFSDHQGEEQQILMKSSMEDLFIKYRVNAAFSGHVHGYERTNNVAHEALDPAGPMYVIIGDGGNREGHASGFLDSTPPVWSAFRDNTIFGHALVTLLNETHAEFTWEKNVAEGVFETADSFIMENQYYL
ncbi:hypothetical protein TrST_g3955 [Triparma strigata]|uniref:Purple acid phosphatase n=1 Tax=Triparma strigata TaxID=1606541 RepID=A0A9W6ZQM3_9STRA|nr:hypothetical protein TrST_g3955 [Triparma strigata]